jgi:hypothetical protein
MAVAVEGTPTKSSVLAAASLTWSHTAGGNGLFVGGGNVPNRTYSTCTFNGTSMTEKWDLVDGAAYCRSGGYIMVAPDAGAHNVVLTVAAAADVLVGYAVGLSGLDQSTPTRTVYTAVDASVTVVDSEADDLVIDCIASYSTTVAVGAGQTSQGEDDNPYGNGQSYGVSTEVATGASTVMSWTAGTYYAIGAMALVAAAGAPPITDAPEKLRVLTSARWR